MNLMTCDRCGRDHPQKPAGGQSPPQPPPHCAKCNNCDFATVLSDILLETSTILGCVHLDARRRSVLTYFRYRVWEIAQDALENLEGNTGCCEKYAEDVRKAALATTISGKALIVEYDGVPSIWDYLDPDTPIPEDALWSSIFIELSVFEELVQHFQCLTGLKKKEELLPAPQQ